MKKIYTPTIQQMRLLSAVARHQSITRAAEEVNLSQPTVSMQLKTLENKIGLPLLENTGKSIRLTRAGEEVYATAIDVLERLAIMESRLKDIEEGVAGKLSVAVVSSARYFLPQLLGQYKRRFPRVEPRLEITNRARILQRIEQNLDDLYIMGQPPDDAHLVSTPFLENVIVLIAHPNHPLVKRKNITLKDIAKEPIIGREAGSGTRKAVEACFAEHDAVIKAHMEFDDGEVIKQAVMSEFGIAYTSLHAIRLELAAGEIAILDAENFPLYRRWYAFHRQNKNLSKAAQNFLSFLQGESHPSF